MNRVKLYSNGTAVVSREYELKDEKPLALQIPVRKSDLDDVVSSISVFGEVTIVDPPTYTPTNARETTLTLSAKSAFSDMAVKLAGAEVEIQAGTVYQGRLIGLERSRRERDGAAVDQIRLVILTAKGVQQIDDLSITTIRFTEPSIQAEVEKALSAAVAQIRPDGSVVELTLKAHAGPTTAVVVYATPVAAWKIRYQLRISDDGAELDGQAVVDNDTDDDWTNTLITVVTGEPITFSTDLAEISRPARSRVRLVADRAAGAVAAEPVMEIMSAPPDDDDYARASSPPRMARHAMMGSLPAPPPPTRARQTQAEVQDSGDFSIFTSPNPITLAAKRSAVVPLHATAVKDCQVSLFYKEADDPHRPFRAIRFNNPASFSLGRGVCEVMIDGEFRGKAVLASTMPGEEALIIHARETGVRIVKESSRVENRRLRVKISSGTIVHEELNRRRTVYNVVNHHAESFALEIEHPLDWKDSTLEILNPDGRVQALEIAGGKRLRATLPAKRSIKIRVRESRVERRAVTLSAAWLASNIVDVENPGPNHADVQNCLKIQKKIDELNDSIKNREAAAKTILAEQERLMKMIPKALDPQANAWRTDLATREDELRLINRSQIPELQKELALKRVELEGALSKLQYDWAAETE